MALADAPILNTIRGGPMTDTNGHGPVPVGPDVEAHFAGMLSELEDVATSLTNRHSRLARELADVEAELHRVEAVRAAMTGKPKPAPSASRSRPPRDAAKVKVDAILEWGRERDEFTGREAAEQIGVKPQGVGPILAGMVRREEVHVRVREGERIYTVAGG